MQFFVHGIDGDGVAGQLDELAEAHWTYMDRFAGQLVARGPTLSADGEEHTGSVHVLEAPDLEAARRFALDEPYARAGLYSSVSVTPWWNALGGTMWDRPPATRDLASTLVIARWPQVGCEPEARADAWREATRSITPGGARVRRAAARRQLALHDRPGARPRHRPS